MSPRTHAARRQLNDRGSLALEQILFIGAIVVMSLGLFAFYGNLGDYFQTFDISALRRSVPTPGGATNTNP